MKKLYLISTLVMIFLIGFISANTLIRNVPFSIQAGEEFEVTYSADATGKWGASIVDSISGGCKFPSGSNEYKSVILSEDGTTKTIKVTTPSGGSCTFSGDYKFGTDPIINFPDDIIQIVDKNGNPIPVKVDYDTDSYQTNSISSKGSTFECVNGNWRKLSIESYCRDSEDNLYIDESGNEHCRPDSYPSVNNGAWCSQKETSQITGEVTQIPKTESNNFLVILISIASILIVFLICLTIVLVKRKK